MGINMKLNDFTNSRAASAVRALRENYNVNLRLENLDRTRCVSMLREVKKIMSESRSQPGYSAKSTSSEHMKLVFVEQALSSHLQYLNSRIPEIVLENKEVDRSEVLLAAQEMANSLQDMVEDVSDMLNKELPALVQSIENKIGIREAASFKQSTGELLNNILNTLKEGTDNLSNSVNGLTGEEGVAPEMAAPEGLPGVGEVPEMPTGELPAPETQEEPELMGTEAGAGRSRR